MAHSAARRRGGAGLIRIGGMAALAGGLAWVVKGAAILAVDEQPPLVFELALPLFGLGLLGVGLLVAHGSRRTVVVVLACLAAGTGGVALVSELLDLAWDATIATSAVALLLGQLSLPRRGPAPAALTFWTGVALVPSIAVGGALAEIDERLLEIPLGCVGIAWMVVGWGTLRDPRPAHRADGTG